MINSSNDYEQLEAWYKFESKVTEGALRDWCKENDISLEGVTTLAAD